MAFVAAGHGNWNHQTSGHGHDVSGSRFSKRQVRRVAHEATGQSGVSLTRTKSDTIEFIQKTASTPRNLFVRDSTFAPAASRTASHTLTCSELQALSKTFGYMPRVTQIHQERPPLELVEERISELDDNLRSQVQQICDRLHDDQIKPTGCVHYIGSAYKWVASFFRPGILKEISFEITVYFVYSLLLQYYAYINDWTFKWSAANQDTIYYPALVMSFVLSFRASSCMDRYSMGRKCIFEMQKHLRDMAYKVVTRLVIDEQHPDVEATDNKLLKQRYFKHELRRMTQMLFVCAARDLNDSAADDGEIDEEEVLRLQCAMTYTEQAAVHVTHSSQGHVLRVHLAAAWLTKLIREAEDDGLFDNNKVFCDAEENIDDFKSAWLKARHIAYTEMPHSVIHLLWVLANALNFVLPWEYVSVCRWMTWLPSLFISVSFFGIVKIASNLENPFGFDDDDIPVWEVARDLDEEISLMTFYSALDEVGGENLYRGLSSADHIFIQD